MYGGHIAFKPVLLINPTTLWRPRCELTVWGGDLCQDFFAVTHCSRSAQSTTALDRLFPQEAHVQSTSTVQFRFD